MVDGDTIGDTESPAPRSRMIRITQKLVRQSLGSAIADFIHSFVYESIPVVVLPGRKHESVAVALCETLDAFRNCHHYGRVTEDGVCAQCSTKLSDTAMKYVDLLPNAVRFISIMVQAQCEGDEANVRTLAFFIGNFLKCALKL